MLRWCWPNWERRMYPFARWSLETDIGEQWEIIQNQFSMDLHLQEKSIDCLNNLISSGLLEWLWCFWKIAKAVNDFNVLSSILFNRYTRNSASTTIHHNDYNSDYLSNDYWNYHHPLLPPTFLRFFTFFTRKSNLHRFFDLNTNCANSLSLPTTPLTPTMPSYDKSWYTAANTTGMRASGQSRWQSQPSTSSSPLPSSPSSGSGSDSDSYALGASNQEDERNRQVSTPALISKVW